LGSPCVPPGRKVTKTQGPQYGNAWGLGGGGVPHFLEWTSTARQSDVALVAHRILHFKRRLIAPAIKCTIADKGGWAIHGLGNVVLKDRDKIHKMVRP